MLWFASLAWLGLLSAAAMAWFLRLDGARETFADRRVLAALGACAVLFGTGITFGWPGPGWPLDEMDPATAVRAFSHRFSGGWSDKYPPVYFYLLNLTYVPALVAEHQGWISIVAEPVRDLLTLQGRALNVLLSLGTVGAIAILTVRLGHARNAWVAALLAGTFLPLAFYAKTNNVDAAYLFWFALSLVFFARMRPGDSLHGAIGLGTTAALAIATKDHAYSLYVLPGLYLLYRRIRGRADAPRVQQLGAATAAAALVFAAAHNLVFNIEGFREHVRELVGPASAYYRAFEPGPSGQVQLLRAIALQSWQCLGWSGLTAVILGVIVLVRARRALPPWLWLTSLSSYLTFMTIVGYSYDRFLLPFTIVCAVPAAVGIGRLLDRPAWFRGARLCGAVLVAWTVLRAVGLDVVMLTDSRYAAEHFLRLEVRAGATVGSYGHDAMLPRLGAFTRQSVRPGIADTLAARPDFIVVNVEHMQRFDDDPVRVAWLAWLESGTGPYREVFRRKAPVPWYSPLRLDRRFTDRVEDPFTNLDKVNPEIAIFQRR